MTGKSLLLFVEEGATADDVCYLKCLRNIFNKEMISNKEMILWTKVHYSTIWGSLPHGKSFYQLPH